MQNIKICWICYLFYPPVYHQFYNNLTHDHPGENQSKQESEKEEQTFANKCFKDALEIQNFNP